MKNNETLYALIPLTLLCVTLVYLSVSHSVHDFANYYFGGKLLADGRFTADIYFPYWFNQQIVAAGQSPLFAGFAPNTPFLALLFIPFSVLSISTAKLVFNCISVVLFIYSIYRLAVFYKVKPYWMLLIPVVFFVPVRNEILFGQVYLLLFFFVAEYWLAYQKQQNMKAAVFLGFAILLKVFPMLLLAIFVFRKQFRPLLYTIFICALLMATTLFFCSLGVWQFYVTDVLSKASAGGIASAFVENYQSLFMFLKRIFIFEEIENPRGLFYAPAIFKGLVFGLKLFVVGIGFYLTKQINNKLLLISYWMFALIMLSPYGSTYTFVFMLFPFLAIANTEMPNVKKMIFLSLLIFINNFPLSMFIGNVFPFNYWRLFALLLLFGLFVSLVWKTVSWKIVTAVSVAALLVVAIVSETPEKPKYLLANGPLLIYDYQIGNNLLTYDYWDDEGMHSASVPFEASSVDSVILKRNEIYFAGKPVATDDGHKQKAVIVDGKTLLYLSDADRGIGFYTLRTVKLK